MTLSLNGNSITTEGVKQRIVISSIEALACYSELLSSTDSLQPGNWYLNNQQIRATNETRGWEVDRETVSGHQLVRLRRVSDSAMEGEFTCHIEGDINSFASVEIYYPSELKM